MRQAALVIAGRLNQATGGYRYDAKLVDGLRGRGWRIDVVELAGRWPQPDSRAVASLNAALAARRNGERVIVDGLVLGGLPDVAHRHAQRLNLIALVHHALADETGLSEAERVALHASEARALAAVRAVVVTSAFTARRLTETRMLACVPYVVTPGAAKQPVAPGSRSGPPQLTCVATLTPRKGHDVLVDALAQVRDLDWRCQFIGALDRDRAHARNIEKRIAAADLGARIDVRGTLNADALVKTYAATDLFVLASYFEGYGMGITEALAHGLPIVATSGGALAETVPRAAGRVVAPGDTAAFATALRELLTDPSAMEQARAGALAARERLRDWPERVAAFEHVLESIPVTA